MRETSAAGPAGLAETVPPAEIERVAALLRDMPLLGGLLDAVPDVYVILNRTRQIVFANARLRRQLEAEGGGSPLGMRVGEALGCANSCASRDGCGTSEFCQHCGSFNAMLGGLRDTPSVEEWRLTKRTGSGESLDLRVTATPLRCQGEPLVSFVAVDISSEKRREALERVFLHDIGNTVSGIVCVAEVLRETAEGRSVEFVETLMRASLRLMNEFIAQRDLLAAEHGDLQVKPERFQARALMEEVLAFYQGQGWAEGRTAGLAPGAQDPELICDRTLLGRVLGNMLKNALEACAPGEAVTLDCAGDGGEVEFRVHNPQGMPPEVQRQVFQRSFSTKGLGRGLGTYSIRLLAERYLRGRASFDSSAAGGTVFRVRLPAGPAAGAL